MKLKTIITIVLCVVLAGAVAFGIYWAVNNSNKVKDVLSGANLYSKEDLDNAYSDGYDMALLDKVAMESQLAELRATLTEKQAQLDELIILSERLKVIENQNNNNILKIEALESEIDRLYETILAYEKIIQEIEESGMVIATFVVDGQVHTAKKCNPGEIVNVDNPIDTDNYKFNGWMINDIPIDLDNYVINESVTFYADLTYKYTIEFYNDNNLISTQVVWEDEEIAIPEIIDVEYGYEFKGWSLNGSDVIEVEVNPTSNTKYYAVIDILRIQAEISFYKTTITGSGNLGDPIYNYNYYKIDVDDKYKQIIEEIAMFNADKETAAEGMHWYVTDGYGIKNPTPPTGLGVGLLDAVTTYPKYYEAQDETVNEDKTIVILHIKQGTNYTMEGSWTIEITLVPKA